MSLLACDGSAENCQYMLLSNKLSTLIDLLNYRLDVSMRSCLKYVNLFVNTFESIFSNVKGTSKKRRVVCNTPFEETQTLYREIGRQQILRFNTLKPFELEITF